MSLCFNTFILIVSDTTDYPVQEDVDAGCDNNDQDSSDLMKDIGTASIT